MINRGLLCILILFFTSFNLWSQSLFRISLNEKVDQSSLVIEGKVVDQFSFWNDNHSVIYTSNTVEVYKVFKGKVSKSTVEVITIGGELDGKGVRVSEVLKLNTGDIGAFFLYPNEREIKSPKTLHKLWDVYSSSQGFIKYDLNNETASEPFGTYKNISKDFYNDILSYTKSTFENKKPSFSTRAFSIKNNRGVTLLAPVITSFSPATVTAGAFLDPTNNMLTINGSGFGTGSGSAAVLFDDADNGPGGTASALAYNSPLIISWADAQISLRVPDYAGTGILQVRDAAGSVVSAATNLQVLYSVLTLADKETTLINANGTGGYTISYSTNTAGSGINFDTDPAKATFKRALTTWQQIVGANIVEGSTTTIQAVAGDGVCVVMYDNQNTGMPPLASGVLAVCINWYSYCAVNPTVNQVLKTEFEVIVRNPAVSAGSATFTNGPCPPNSINFSAVDLETVILHELGHALNLGHILDGNQGGSIGYVNPAKLMNPTISNSVRRNTPDYSANAAALYAITPQGAILGSCLSSGEMTPLAVIAEPKDECPSSFPASITSPGTVINFDLVHATSNRFVDPAYTQLRCGSSDGASITNNAYYAFRTGASGILTLLVSGYSTTPVELASCTPLNVSIPVTGVRLVLYKVNSCPTAGSFPTAIACRSITANGALSDIAGLSANSTYLIYTEGFENTKASFSLTLGGTTLPIKFESFSGSTAEKFNLIKWAVDRSYNIEQLLLEKSSDGINFFNIDSTDGNLITTTDFYYDHNPYAHQNFYRLAAINTDGAKQYSNIILLTRNDRFFASVSPNPVEANMMNVEINSEKMGKYNFALYSPTGYLIYTKLVNIMNQRQLVHIPANGIASGIYFLKISNNKNEFVQNVTVTIRH